MNSIFSRRSIRKYLDKPIPDSALKLLLKAAMAAPSAVNQQPWHFIIVKDRSTLIELCEVHPHGSMLRNAPVVILVCGNPNAGPSGEFWVQDCSAATMNILIAAQAQNLGAVWLGVYPKKDRIDNIRDILNIPETIYPLTLIPIGYPAEKNRLLGGLDWLRSTMTNGKSKAVHIQRFIRNFKHQFYCLILLAIKRLLLCHKLNAAYKQISARLRWNLWIKSYCWRA